MKLSDVKEALEADVLVGQDKMDTEVTGGAAGDLMSDLLRNPKEGALLLTGLTSIQVIHTSIIAGMSAIIFVRGKMPGQDVLNLAQENELPILTTKYNMYSSCGRLFSKGLRSIR